MFSHRGFLRETAKKHQVYFHRGLAWRGLNSRKLQQPTRKPKRENFSGRVKYDSSSPASYDCIAENMADWRNLYIVMLIMPSKHYLHAIVVSRKVVWHQLPATFFNIELRSIHRDTNFILRCLKNSWPLIILHSFNLISRYLFVNLKYFVTYS